MEYENIKSSNWYMEGFECTLENGELSFAAGSLVMPSETLAYEAFEFDVEGDEEIPVVYDVYLLANGEPHVDRTEVSSNNVAFYDGTEEVRHCLMSFQLNPGDIIDNLTLVLRNVIKEDSDETEPEPQQPDA